MKNVKTCMDIRDFAELISREVSRKLGGRCQVKLQEVLKNNGVILQGIVILEGKQNFTPTIYLNDYLDAFEDGMALENIVQQVLRTYREHVFEERVDMSFFRDFDRVNDGICYRMISKERNRVLLEHIPHVDFLDLSICFFYAYQTPGLGTGSILIHNNHADMWGSSTELLMKLAQENTRRRFPYRLQRMKEIIGELLEGGTDDCFGEIGREDPPMYVLGNLQRQYGATCMIYPGVMETIAEEMGGDLYILPSSIHEIILLPEKTVNDVEFVHNMIREVNATQVAPEDILSNSLYFYDSQHKCVKVALG